MNKIKKLDINKETLEKLNIQKDNLISNNSIMMMDKRIEIKRVQSRINKLIVHKEINKINLMILSLTMNNNNKMRISHKKIKRIWNLNKEICFKMM